MKVYFNNGKTISQIEESIASNLTKKGKGIIVTEEQYNAYKAEIARRGEALEIQISERIANGAYDTEKEELPTQQDLTKAQNLFEQQLENRKKLLY